MARTRYPDLDPQYNASEANVHFNAGHFLTEMKEKDPSTWDAERLRLGFKTICHAQIILDRQKDRRFSYTPEIDRLQRNLRKIEMAAGMR